ncbi:Gfo/Idh/MocA family protein [Pedobacter psychroterrae]|uniref:Gfo/Idh/MocA family oxidoreductase n=1 Tax=Pedobacter psychroterrae TaxID=2530453 RepID=A0A4R0NAV6_9SPHI|nr:Gfo/Idh/MocA family oxidoreductase [Pedobacter psychroterrae]TCC97409.1 Gfo/Idh/MocA family oxidoreductase [Pedobacter psychroterrae]
MKHHLKIRSYILCLLGFTVITFNSIAQEKLNVAVAGLNHDHVYLIMNAFEKSEVNIIGIAEANPELVERFKKRYKLADNIFYTDIKALLKVKKPDIVLAYNAIFDHLSVVEAAAPLGISVMVEKPLAVSVKHAERMAQLARQHKIHLLTNYETTWYSSNQEAYTRIKKDKSIGEIRKIVAHDGHEGPKEIGVSKEFLGWLTDPVMNGGGAIIDFGCYGANLMTWLMDGQAPISVSAVTKQIKKEVYPKVDDDATIVLEYPEATGIIQGSWNWPFSIKDLEVFGETGYVQAVNPNTLRIKNRGKDYQTLSAKPLEVAYRDHLNYLSRVLKNQINPQNDLSSLENNLMVVRILEAAKQSAKEGKKIYLKK